MIISFQQRTMLEAPRTIAMIRSEDVALDGRPLSPLDIGSSETPGYRDRPDWSWTRYRKLWTLIIRRGIEDAGTRADCRRLVSRAFRDSRQRARPVVGFADEDGTLSRKATYRPAGGTKRPEWERRPELAPQRETIQGRNICDVKGTATSSTGKLTVVDVEDGDELVMNTFVSLGAGTRTRGHDFRFATSRNKAYVNKKSMGCAWEDREEEQ